MSRVRTARSGESRRRGVSLERDRCRPDRPVLVRAWREQGEEALPMCARGGTVAPLRSGEPDEPERRPIVRIECQNAPADRLRLRRRARGHRREGPQGRPAPAPRRSTDFRVAPLPILPAPPIGARNKSGHDGVGARCERARDCGPGPYPPPGGMRASRRRSSASASAMRAGASGLPRQDFASSAPAEPRAAARPSQAQARTASRSTPPPRQ